MKVFAGCLVLSFTSIVSVAVLALSGRLLFLVLYPHILPFEIVVLGAVVTAGAMAAQLRVMATKAIDHQWFARYAPILYTRRPWFVLIWTVFWTCTGMVFLAWLAVVAV
jgi:hypothetical protein